jgi:hypothetical protein
MSAAVAIINPAIAFLVGEDRLRLPKNGGSEEGGDQPHILWGNPMRWAILSHNTLSLNASIKPNHYSKLKLQNSQNIFDLFHTTIKTVVMQQYAERIMQKTMVVACLLQLSLFY